MVADYLIGYSWWGQVDNVDPKSREVGEKLQNEGSV